MKTFRLLLFLCLFSNFAIAQIPDFTTTDINGVEHSLYEDYLDEGKMVVINLTATWAAPAWDWHNTGILEDFYQQNAGSAVVMNLEIDLATTDEEVMGNGNNTMGDWTENTSYPFLNPTDPAILEIFEPAFVPAIIIICPGGTAYSSYPGQHLEQISGLDWGAITDPDYLFQLGISTCNWNPYEQLIEGKVYHDENLTCEDEMETGMPNVHIEVSDGTYTYYRMTNDDGVFKSPAQDNIPYTVTAEVPSPLWDLCVDSHKVLFDGTTDTMSVSFGLQSTSDCPMPEVDISAPLLWRCFSNTIYVQACNTGTVALEDGELTVVLDPAFIPLAYSIEPSSIDGNTLTFTADLGVLECLDIQIEIEVSCDAELGQEHCYSAELTGSNLCNTFTGIAYDQECQENVGSYDPNDKRSFPRGEGPEHFILANTDIEYHIRFQNTGTFMALNVVIVDTISELFDLSTLRLGASSHDYTLEITGERTLEFSFNNIMLPDSTSDLAGSQGFLSFYISQVPDLVDGTVLENEAAIFFDFNEPIITEKAFLTIGEVTSNKDIAKTNLPFQIQPNPAKDQVRVTIQGEVQNQGTYRLYHSSGQLMRSQNYSSNTFDLITQSLSAGVYFLEIEDQKGQRGLQKLIIQ